MRVVAQCLGVSTARIPDAPSLERRNALAQALRQYGGDNLTVDLNYATGTCFSTPTCQSSVQAVANVLKHGITWIDYGPYPFEYCPGSSLFGTAGIGLLWHLTGVRPPQPAPGQTFLATVQGRLGQLEQTFGAPVVVPGEILANTFDPYAFNIRYWSWAVNAHYPYPYGLPVAEDLSRRPDFAVGPGTIGHATVPGPHGQAIEIYVYPAFGFRVGRAWYFWATSEIPPDAYAAFIARTLGAANTSPPQVRQTIARPATPPTLQRGSTGAAVRQLQTLLNRYGAHLTVDGIFGPQTEAAVRAFQAANGLAVDGIVGPQTWSVLLSGRARPIPAAAPAPAPSPAPAPAPSRPAAAPVSRPSAPATRPGPLAGLEQSLASALHVSTATSRLILLGLGLGAAVALLSPRGR